VLRCILCFENLIKFTGFLLSLKIFEELVFQTQLFPFQCTIIEATTENHDYDNNGKFLSCKRKDVSDVQLFTKTFQRSTAKIKMQCKDFVRMRDEISWLCFQATRENGIRWKSLDRSFIIT